MRRVSKEKVKEINQNNMMCPMCEGSKLKCKRYKDTYIYICEECSFVGFENIEVKDIKNSNKYFRRGVKNGK